MKSYHTSLKKKLFFPRIEKIVHFCDGNDFSGKCKSIKSLIKLFKYYMYYTNHVKL